MTKFRTMPAIAMVTALFIPLATFAVDSSYPPAWAYDEGPILSENVNCTKKSQGQFVDQSMGCQLVRIKTDIPYFPAVDKAVMNKREKGGSNKFRPAYGDIPWRMIQKPNSMKILFIGQDGTHIAEAAGRPATAGFGGRAHDLANYFGVDYSAGFINTYAFTIKGQASSRNTPYLENCPELSSNTCRVRFGNIMNNGLWLITQDLNSPIAQWRNKLIDWIIRNNKQSLKLIVGFGGTARESMSTYVISKGGKVGTWYSQSDLRNIKVAEVDLKYAGGNNQFPVPLNKSGQDLYADLLGFNPDYNVDRDTGKSEGQEEAMKALENANNMDLIKQKIFITNAGVKGSGILHPAQLGGFQLDQIEINGQTTRSLKGITLDDGTKLNSDVLLVQLPHPTYLSNVKRSQGGEVVSNLVADAVRDLEPYADAGWKIEKDAFRPEIQGKNLFFGPKENGNRQKYTYGRSDIGPEYYDFGTPNNRMVSVSSAKRLRVKSYDGKNKGGVIMFGSRDQPLFDKGLIQDMLVEEPNDELSPLDIWTSRPRIPELLTTFDKGPGLEYAKLMKTTLPGREIYDDVQSSRSVGDFAHYRGTFNNPKVVVLADPDGYDGLMTARAATGTRGQYLHGLISNIVIDGEKVENDYLVISTLPYGMDGASESQWQAALAKTEKYREALVKKLVQGGPKLILADGKYAYQSLNKIIHSSDHAPMIHIQKQGLANDSGISSAMVEIIAVDGVDVIAADIQKSNIPRAHLSYYARAWEGTTGDRVLELKDGKVFAMVAPDWAVEQRPQTSAATNAGIADLKKIQSNYCLPTAKEKVGEFLNRAGSCEITAIAQ